MRAAQIAKNSPIYASIPYNELVSMNALQIAEEELRQRVLPYTLRRFLPDGHYEDWHLNELEIFEWFHYHHWSNLYEKQSSISGCPGKRRECRIADSPGTSLRMWEVSYGPDLP